MRVRISYTVEAGDVLTEAGKILGLSASTVQNVIKLYNDIQSELQKDEPDSEESPNLQVVRDSIDECRAELLEMDTRLQELVEIINGADDLRSGRLPYPTEEGLTVEETS